MKTKMRDEIAEREQALRRKPGVDADTYNLVRCLKDALTVDGERPDPYVMAKAGIALILESQNSGSQRETIPALVAGIVGTHRHLQGQGIWAILTALGHLPKLENATDARNEHAYNACATLRESLSERIYWPD